MLDLALGNMPRQLTGVSVEGHFGDSDHNSIIFKIVLNRDKFGPWGRCLRIIFNKFPTTYVKLAYLWFQA